MIVLAYQASLFDEWEYYLPYIALCTDNLNEGLRKRPRKTAMQKRYLQLNPATQRWALVFDLDKDDSPLRARDADLPEPNATIVNRTNNHAHLLYALREPICTSDFARRGPLNYAALIQDAYTDKLDADRNYRHLISKNPWNYKAWEIIQGESRGYDLDYLASFVNLDKAAQMFRRRYVAGEYAGLGRNCAAFDMCAHWAYSAVRDYFGATFGEWHEAVARQIEQINAEVIEPSLPTSEIKATSKSIARWVWEHFDAKTFSIIQRARVMKRWKNQEYLDNKECALEMIAAGYSIREVSKTIKISERTVSYYKREQITRCTYFQTSANTISDDYVLGVASSDSRRPTGAPESV